MGRKVCWLVTSLLLGEPCCLLLLDSVRRPAGACKHRWGKESLGRGL